MRTQIGIASVCACCRFVGLRVCRAKAKLIVMHANDLMWAVAGGLTGLAHSVGLLQVGDDGVGLEEFHASVGVDEVGHLDLAGTF